MHQSLNLPSYNLAPFTLTFLIDNNKVLALKRASNKKIYPDKLSAFGGKVEPGEDLFTSARREFLEETGLAINTLELRGMLTRILDTGYINEMYIFVAHGFTGQLHQDSGEGTAQWLDIQQFLSHPDIVDHIPLYLNQVLEGKDFYCGIARYEQDKMVEYTDNRQYFERRRGVI